MVDEQVLIEFGTRQDVVLVEESSLMRFQVNLIDPLMGLTWTAPEFDDSTWTFGSYGIGYEAVTGAENLLRTTVADGAFSVYTRARFEIADTSLVDNLWFGADYDDAVVVWINGVEVLRTSQMPPGDPAWNADPSNHESSNGPAPYYEPQMNISALGIPALVDGENVIAIGVYNNVALDGTASSDLVLVPRLSMNRTPTMRYLANTTDPGLGLSWTTEAFNDSSW
ncbi:MAG: hypothetical protein GWN46_02075, partial [Gammaproteobacteria bacterium]|nr:hypothetical protein [Gammaproteobacteria bacterium]